MQSQNFNIVATNAVNGDVVLVQDQLARARDAACPAHAWMGLKFGHGGPQFQHKAGGAGRVVLAMKPAISSTDASAALVHLINMNQAPYLANTALTCLSVANSPASASLMPS